MSNNIFTKTQAIGARVNINRTITPEKTNQRNFSNNYLMANLPNTTQKPFLSFYSQRDKETTQKNLREKGRERANLTSKIPRQCAIQYDKNFSITQIRKEKEYTDRR